MNVQSVPLYDRSVCGCSVVSAVSVTSRGSASAKRKTKRKHSGNDLKRSQQAQWPE